MGSCIGVISLWVLRENYGISAKIRAIREGKDKPRGKFISPSKRSEELKFVEGITDGQDA